MAYTQFRWYRRHIPACDAWVTIAEDIETGALWFPIRPVCLALRVDSPSQIERIKRSWRLAPALRLIPIPTERRDNGTWARAQQTQSLPYTEFCWWLGDVDPREATPAAREKLLIRQRALMDVARAVMLGDDATVAELRQRVAGEHLAGMQETVSGELHTHCPVCHSPLCIVIAGAHVVAGAEEITER